MNMNQTNQLIPPDSFPPSPSSGMNPLLAILLGLNLVEHACFQLPISLMNIWLQLHTSLIHPNLKCILLAQSVCFCLFAYARVANLLLMFMSDMANWMGGTYSVQLPTMLAIQFMNAIGHILLLERLMASMLSKSYEKCKNFYFTAIWLSILLIYCGYTAWCQVMGYASSDQMVMSPFIIFSAYLFSGMALIEFILILVIGGHNVKKYREQLRIQGKHNLSERYQIRDNIRSARQLGPTFFLHFLNVMISCEFPLVLYYGLIKDLGPIQMFSAVTQVLIALGNILIEFTIITRHPALRQNALLIIQKIIFKMNPIQNRIGNSEPNTTMTPVNKANESEQYFRLLKEEWDQSTTKFD